MKDPTDLTYQVTIELDEVDIRILADPYKMESSTGENGFIQKLALLHKVRVAVIKEMRIENDKLFKAITDNQQRMEAIGGYLPGLERREDNDV